MYYFIIIRQYKWINLFIINILHGNHYLIDLKQRSFINQPKNRNLCIFSFFSSCFLFIRTDKNYSFFVIWIVLHMFFEEDRSLSIYYCNHSPSKCFLLAHYLNKLRNYTDKWEIWIEFKTLFTESQIIDECFLL